MLKALNVTIAHQTKKGGLVRHRKLIHDTVRWFKCDECVKHLNEGANCANIPKLLHHRHSSVLKGESRGKNLKSQDEVRFTF